VVAGPLDALEAIKAPAEAAGFRVRPLPVSAAFHSPCVAAARDPFAQAVSSASFGAARKPVYSTTTATPYPDNGLGRDLLADQLIKPVNFLGLINAMYDAGARVFVEMGARSVLTGLVGRILGDKPHTAIALDPSGGKESGDTGLQKAVGHLLARGVELDLAYLVDREPLPALKPTTFSATTIMLHGSNIKPVPPERPKLAPRVAAAANGHAARRNGGLASESTIDGAGGTAPASPAAPPAPALPPPPGDSHGLAHTTHAALSAFMQQQQITAQVHQEFLRTSQEAMRTIAQLFEMHARQIAGMAPAPPRSALPHSALPQSALPHSALPVSTTAETPTRPVSPQTVPAPVTIPHPVRQPAVASDELATGLLAIVSDKTGYPVDMLKLDMDLEADLGIDSIKRVEILGAMQATFPGAATVETEKLGELHTLQEILDYLGQSGGRAEVAEPAAPVISAAQVARSAGVSSAGVNGDGHATRTGETERPFEAVTRPPPIRRYTVTAVPISAGPTAGPLTLPADHAILISDDGQGYATALATELTRAGHSVVIAHLPSRPAPLSQDARVRPLDWTDEQTLTQELESLGTNVGAVIHLAALRPTPAVRDLSPSDLKAALAEQVRGAFILARAASASLRKAGGLFATVTAMDGAFGFVTGMNQRFAAQGALAGLVKTLGIEWPTVICRAFDLDPSMAPVCAAQELAREVRHGHGPVETGLSAGVTRGLAMTHAAPQPATPLTLDERSVVLVTGGARGVTADVALGMAKRWRPTLVLLGRSPAPAGTYDWCQHVPDGAPLKKVLLERLRGDGTMVKPAELERIYREALAEREITETLDRLRAAGSTVEYRSVDVRDAAAVTEAVREARTLGTLAGLVHGAGVIHDKLIEQKTPEQFDHVFETKVLGLHALLEALRHGELEFIALFSSIAGRAGNKGQSDYAMANECLNKMAVELKAQRAGCHVVSIGWGPWQGGMVTPELERAFLEQGIAAIPRDEGVRLFLDEIAAGRHADTEIVVAGLPIPRTLEFDVMPEQDRYLDDHQLNGKPVVPAMMVLEWVAEAAQSTFPGMRLASVDDFKVLKGVVCETPRTRVRIALEELAGSSARTRVLAAQVHVVDDGQPRPSYRATVRVTSEAQAAPAFTRPGDLASNGYSMMVTEAYRERLFHGPRFQVIETVDGMSDLGMVARLRTSDPSGWSAHPPARWATDPAVLDGALQMLVLWLREKLGNSSLPSSLANYVQYAPLSSGPRVTAYMRMKTVTAHTGGADVVMVNEAGQVVAEMKGVEMTVSENLNPMFRRAAVTPPSEVWV
jgi:NAD(P)-dependent dehydrogenase (short-subunit alcohol dehydrogenase family)/malonyl CoA-acyl carrier protein transacylase